LAKNAAVQASNRKAWPSAPPPKGFPRGPPRRLGRPPPPAAPRIVPASGQSARGC
jgi:hypothetical protein